MATVWLAAGLLLSAAELVAPGVYLLWLGLAAIGVGVVLVLVGLPFGLQVGLFAALAFVSVLAGRAWQRRDKESDRDPNAPAADLVGQRCRALAFDGADGRVRFRDGEWLARATPTDAASILPGDGLVIVGVEGTTLVVRRL
jgi:inner membrane protein